MTDELRAIIAAARNLSPREKLELLQAVSHDLQETYALTEGSAAFWTTRSIEDLVRSQPAPTVTDIHELAVDFWPADESADDLNAFVAAQRQADASGKT